jgi:hypothetical protein
MADRMKDDPTRREVLPVRREEVPLERAMDGHLVPKDARPDLHERAMQAAVDPSAPEKATDERRGREIDDAQTRYVERIRGEREDE